MTAQAAPVVVTDPEGLHDFTESLVGQKFYILNGNAFDVEFRITASEFTSLFRVEPSKGQITKGMKLEVNIDYIGAKPVRRELVDDLVIRLRALPLPLEGKARHGSKTMKIKVLRSSVPWRLTTIAPILAGLFAVQFLGLVPIDVLHSPWAYFALGLVVMHFQHSFLLPPD